MERYNLNFFLNLCARGHITYLPLDVRLNIWNKMFPIIRLRCRYCDKVLLIESERNSLFSTSRYTLVKDIAVCMVCLQMNIQYLRHWIQISVPFSLWLDLQNFEMLNILILSIFFLRWLQYSCQQKKIFQERNVLSLDAWKRKMSTLDETGTN